ncbi:MAG: hypothetical protein NC483_03720 [Ruminococcus sp.]|nr:hypothetical protein [Ruminococcus sp.]
MFQNVVFNELTSKFRENKLAHAYLIETNNNTILEQDLRTFIKLINCENTYQDNCTACNLCNLINKNSIPSLKIIEPDGSSIKKNQIIELKNNFSTIPVYSKYNIYIIKSAEKLNPSSANAMLKFLEEPESHILGFFITNNKDIMLDTIKSRCNILTINYNTNSFLEELNLEEETYENYKTLITEYLTKIKTKEIINHKDELARIIANRNEVLIFFQIIFNIYYHKYLSLLNKEYDTNLLEIYNPPDKLPIIIKKMQIISQILNNMSYNISIELVLDKFVIEMRGANG